MRLQSDAIREAMPKMSREDVEAWLLSYLEWMDRIHGSMGIKFYEDLAFNSETGKFESKIG